MATQARSIASLTISFGLVAIPVKLYSATVSSERISFNLLRQKDGSRVKQQYVAVNDGKIVERSEMVKGYEFAKDQYVMFSAEELKALEDTTSHAIDIGQFVPLESVDPLVFRRHLLSGAGQGRRQAIHPARHGAAQVAAMRGGPLDFPRQGTHRGDPGDRRRSGDASAAFQSGGSRPEGFRHRSGAGVGAGVEARAAAHRTFGARSASTRTNSPTSTSARVRRRFRERSRARKCRWPRDRYRPRAAMSST